MVKDLWSLLFIVYGENENEDDVRISNQLDEVMILHDMYVCVGLIR